MGGPDALSRAPLQLKEIDERSPRNPVAPDGDFEDLFISELQRTDLSDPLIEKIQEKAKTDSEYQSLRRAVHQGFPASSKAEIGEYWSVREGLFESQGLIFRNQELLVPRTCRHSVIRALHQAHQGLRAMLRRANGNVFWPNIRRDLQCFRDECLYCQSHLPQQQRQPMMSVDVPTAPGLVIASDYFQSGGKEFVLFVDLFSSWTEYFKVSSRRPETLIQKLRQFMTQNGVPRILYSDKGSAYDSLEFRTFCKDWNIELVTCSGEYPQGNGTAESAVKRVKKWLSGANSEDELARAILAWHQTPITDGRPTPAQIHLGRNVRDELSTQVSPCTIPWKEAVERSSLVAKSSKAVKCQNLRQTCS